MEDKIRPEITVSGAAKQYQAEPLRSRGGFYVGIDVGSTSSDVVVLDDTNKVLFCDYKRTLGRPVEKVRSQLQEAFKQLNPTQIRLAAATGNAGRFLARALDIPFVNEVPAQAAAIYHLYPNLQQATVIDMGGQDSKLIFLSVQQGTARIRDFTLNTVCAAGTGSFLDQQAQRLGIDIEGEFGRLALQSKSVPRMAGRCSVFAKSDMIHLQQQATPMCDIIAGLCLALATNLKSNLGCGREFVKPIIFTGGVAANIGVAKALEKVFELTDGELIVPDMHFFTGAIGAVLVAKSAQVRTVRSIREGAIRLERLDSYLSQRGAALEQAPRRQPLKIPALPPPESRVYEYLLEDTTEPIDSYVGLDVGSLSTKVVVMDRQKRILAKVYLMTAGRPLEAIRQGLDIVGKKVAGKVRILGAASTGSGRYLTGDFIGADIVINEITAQAAGAAIINPQVDTIFEIGGQDSKYISLENGVVVDFEMNHACAAGTGSFLEEQAQRLGISINNEFAQLAFQSQAPVKLGERCTVFMESDLLSYLQQGAQTGDLVAGLSYSIVANYLNRVVGRRKIGNNICFQGGTAYNKAVWAAFEEVVGKPVCVPDHHEVTGALGAAAIAAEYMQKRATEEGKVPTSAFRGFENLVSLKYTVESFTCEHCPNHCEIKKVQLPGADPLHYGSRCDRYNLKKKEKRTQELGAFEYRRRTLLEYAGLTGKKNTLGRPKARVGIPMALISWEYLPMYSRFLKALGFEVVLSGQTDKRLIRIGVEAVTAQPCFPVKVAYGHVTELLEKKVDFIFLPSIVSSTASFPQNKHNQICPYVQSFAHQVKAAFAAKLGRMKIITAPVRLGEGKSLIMKSFVALGKELNVSASRARKGAKEALAAQAGFENALRDKGKEILSRIAPGQKVFVLVSRPYNGCDDGMNLQLPRKLTELGAQLIPMDMLDLSSAKLTDQSLHENVYWAYGQRILRAAEIVRRDPRLFAIYLSNFSCGPDSFISTFFKDIMGQKPCLQLEIDEHSADAGVLTRLEAFLESLKNYRLGSQEQAAAAKQPPRLCRLTRDRTLYIPYMGDSSYGLAACFRAYGQPAEAIPLADEAALLQGRQFTNGKECLPCAITTGDMIKLIRADGFDPAKAAFFMPAASGPCRFGMYNCLHQLILRYAGVVDTPVIAPNQDSSFYREFMESINGSLHTYGGRARHTSATGFMTSVWIAIIGIDLLHKVILCLHPVARDPRQARRAYERAILWWVQAVEKRASFSTMRRLMQTIADELSSVERDHRLRKPKIGIVGEIYVRSHPFANSNIVARLEELGAICDLASLAEWIYYTNFTRRLMARRSGQWRDLFTNVILNKMQHKIERTLAAPLEKSFGKLAEGDIGHVIKLAEPYLHHSFEGEAILTIGKTIEYYHDGFSGVVNVMPFTCMPSTIVSGISPGISAHCGGMPILNLSFDGQEDSTLTTRLEAFVESARGRLLAEQQRIPAEMPLAAHRA
jgi:predicted CoA-substrate-specific enzyme activase